MGSPNGREPMRPVTAARPCPVCSKGDWCLVAADGSAAICQRVESGRRCGDAGWLHRLAEPVLPPPKSADQSHRPTDWRATAERFAANLDAGRRAGLAAALRLPVEALDRLPLIGWKGDENCWTFPECDPAGRVVGITRRFPDGKKMMMAGGRRGLTLPAGWRDRPGPVFVVEGPTDAVAMSHAGLCCIGRPSNSGGADLLAELLADWPADRPVILTGENDRKADGSWPGKAGAEAVAARLGLPVVVSFPPAGSKDVRDWLTHPDRGAAGWPDRGAGLAAALVAAAERIDPPAPPAPPARPRVPEYRPLPVEALPPVMREFASEVAGSVGCDVAFAALPALVVAGAAVGAALVVRPKQGFEEPPLLWLCTVGDSGTGKSPAMRPAARLAFDIDRRLKDVYTAALRKYLADWEAWKAAAAPDPAAEPVAPVRERFAVIDATIERLTVEAAGSPRGLVVVRDELDGWFQSLTRYKGKGGGSDVPNWLSMFDAGPVRYMRRTGEPKEVEADRAFVAMCGGIQPDVLRAALSDHGFVAAGLAARIGFAMPPKACPRWSDRELSGDTERRFAGVLDALRSLPFDPRAGPGRVGLDVAALARFRALNDEFAAAAENLDGGPMAAALPKAVRYALRLALVWHCVSEAAAGRDPGRGCIGDEAMAAGEALARWLVSEAGRVYAVLAERPEDRAARLLAEWVQRKGGQARPRDLMRSNPQKYPTAAAAELALDGLVSAGYGRWEDDPPRAGGGRPGRAFVSRLTPSPDTRQNPTKPHPGEDAPPDTTPAGTGGIGEIPGVFGVVSGFVGCRVEAPAVPTAPPTPTPGGGVVSGQRGGCVGCPRSAARVGGLGAVLRADEVPRVGLAAGVEVAEGRPGRRVLRRARRPPPPGGRTPGAAPRGRDREPLTSRPYRPGAPPGPGSGRTPWPT